MCVCDLAKDRHGDERERERVVHLYFMYCFTCFIKYYIYHYHGGYRRKRVEAAVWLFYVYGLCVWTRRRKEGISWTVVVVVCCYFSHLLRLSISVFSFLILPSCYCMLLLAQFFLSLSSRSSRHIYSTQCIQNVEFIGVTVEFRSQRRVRVFIGVHGMSERQRENEREKTK
jgi:hypothetical protein